MQKDIKRKAFLGMEFVSENVCFFGRRIGKTLNRFDKGEQSSINRHAVQE